MNRFGVRFFQVVIVLLWCVSSVVFAAQSNDTNLDELVKTKQMVIAGVTKRFDSGQSAQMAKIRSFNSNIADILTRSHQLKFLIAVSESNPFEVRIYFKQAFRLKEELTKKSTEIQNMSKEIAINLFILASARQDLEFVLSQASSREQHPEEKSILEGINRFEASLVKIQKKIETVLEKSAAAKVKIEILDKELVDEVAAVWTIYFTQPLFVLFHKDILNTLFQSYTSWAASLWSVVKSKLPGSSPEWGKSFLAFCVLGIFSVLFFKWIMARMDLQFLDKQGGRHGFSLVSGLLIFLWSGFGGASMASTFPANDIFNQFFVFFGASVAILLARKLRTHGNFSNISSPLYPLFFIYTLGMVVQITNMPMTLLGLILPISLGIMALFLWRSARNSLGQDSLRLTLFWIWCCLLIAGLAISGFAFPAVEVFLILFLCCILYQFTSATSNFIQRRLALSREKGSSLFHSVCISLGIPLLWFSAAGLMFIWLADQLGQNKILGWADNVGFIWKDIHIGFIQILMALVLFFMFKTVAKVLKSATEGLCRKLNMEKGSSVPIRVMVGYGIWSIYGLIFLNIMGVKLSSIIVLAGGMSVGIGFGLQHVINNFVSGLILLFGRTIRPGDVVEHEQVLGEVKNVTILNTLIKTRDHTMILIPNANLVSKPLVNMSHGNRSVRLRVIVGAAYDSDVQLVQQLLSEVTEGHPDILKYPKPAIRLEDFGANSLDFHSKFWVNYNGSKRVASDLRLEILEKFRAHGIDIAFPQLDLHLKESSTT